MTRTKQKTKPDSFQLPPNKRAEESWKPASNSNSRDVEGDISPNLVLSFGVFMFIFSLFIYLQTVYPSLPGGDSGELTVRSSLAAILVFITYYDIVYV